MRSWLAAVFWVLVFAVCYIFAVSFAHPNYEKLARDGQRFAQSIVDYRAERGLLPLNLEDLVPRYVTEVPTNRWRLEWGRLSRNAGGRTYVFIDLRTNSPRWCVAGENLFRLLDVPPPTNTFVLLSGEKLYEAKLAEYERRIQKNPNEKWCYESKIDFLVIENRKALARQECIKATSLFPRWWFPQMVLAYLNDSPGAGARQFSEWVYGRPTFANFWYLSRFYRDYINIAAAVQEISRASECPFTNYPQDSIWSGDGMAFDACQLLYTNRQYDLLLKLCNNWQKNSGADWGNKNYLAFMAAAEIAKGEFDKALTHANLAVGESPMWAGNLRALVNAAQKHQTNFVYDAGSVPGNGWSLFTEPAP